MPKRSGSRSAKSVCVPPYSAVAHTISSPVLHRVNATAASAAMPEAKHTQALPPSSAARRRSSTSVVGLEMRV